MQGWTYHTRSTNAIKTLNTKVDNFHDVLVAIWLALPSTRGSVGSHKWPCLNPLIPALGIVTSCGVHHLPPPWLCPEMELQCSADSKGLNMLAQFICHVLKRVVLKNSLNPGIHGQCSRHELGKPRQRAGFEDRSQPICLHYPRRVLKYLAPNP